MEFIGIVYHPKIPNSEPLAVEVCEWLETQEVSAWVGSTFDEEAIHARGSNFSLLVVLGGDGSTLRAARMMMPYKVPIFGLNMGRVGFLSEANPTNWQTRLQKVLQGGHWLEWRLTIDASLHRNGRVIDTFAALNDVVVGRGKHARVLRLQLRVDNDLVTTYTADALIVATPTGSTAYSMAAGGPLLPPRLQNFVVVPVAAHLSLDRALVLHEEAEIDIRVEMDHEATLTADGQGGVAIENGDHVIVKKHAQPACFARVDSSGYFYRRLMRRLGYVKK